MPLIRQKKRYQPNHAGLYVPASGFTPTSTESSNFLARTTGLSDTDKGHYDTLITGLVTDGVFATLDLLYILAAPDSTNMLLNLCSSSFGLTSSGSGTFTANQGYASNGSSGYLDTNFTPSTNAVQGTLNSASFGAYSRTSRTGDSSSVAIGGIGANGSYTFLTTKNSGNQVQASVNTTSFPSFTSNANAQGAYTNSRTSSSAVFTYKNGSSTSLTVGGTQTSNSLTNGKLFVSAFNNNGSPTQYTTDQIAAAWYGSGLTGANAVLLHTRINNYLTAYGTNVY